MENKIFYQLREIGILVKRKMDASMASLDCHKMTRLHCMVIEYLHQNIGKDVFQKDIEKEFTIRRSTCTQLLKVMESNGIVKKEKVSFDARLVKLTLTESTKLMHKRISEETNKMDEIMGKGLTIQEIEEFTRIIEKIKKNIE
ncbi:MAG: MarR family transcriptional regulator [Clostridia bacterium]